MGGGEQNDEGEERKKLVAELLLKVSLANVGSMGNSLPQTFYILYHCNDRCSVNTKLCENGQSKCSFAK